MRLSLASKISIAVIGVLALAMLSSLVAIFSAYRFEAFQNTLVAENLESLRAAEELEIALLEQRGYVSSYILDGGNAAWLTRLDEHREAFDYWLGRAREVARSHQEREILDRLETVQQEYTQKREEVISLYNAGQEEQARQLLLRDVASLYFDAFELCEQFLDANQKLIDATTASVRRQVEQITIVETVILLITTALGLALLWLFFHGVIIPLRRIAADVRTATGDGSTDARADEPRALGHNVWLLMTNVRETHSDLQQSRTQLAHADKLAAVGKLAASVAHEIRNPLTSVKMWLYSIRRSVGHGGEVQQKFDIVADEIARLETILRNFLEFARPPQLNRQSHPLGLLLDKTIELVHHRLEDQRINLDRADEPELPRIMADLEQLKQVFLNLINNAIEAMPRGGEIRISCSGAVRSGREMVAVEVSDTGPGIPEDVEQRIFEPFFTTKEDGTGLGLCIAASVMARHDGLLELNASTSQGTQWTVWIPAAEAPCALPAGEKR